MVNAILTTAARYGTSLPHPSRPPWSHLHLSGSDHTPIGLGVPLPPPFPEKALSCAMLTPDTRHSPAMVRRYSAHNITTNASTSAAEHFASKTINLIMQVMDQPSLADIQALCLLVIHEWGCRNAVRAYVYLGQAARMAQMYRVVHSHHRQSEPDQFLQDESFRRTLWLIYVLDCFLTSSPGRHPALTSIDVNDVSLPCMDMMYHFGSPVFVRTLNGAPPSAMTESNAQLGEVGEFGHIVLATKAWRNVVEMMTTTTLDTFSEDQCLALEQDIDSIRQSLPPHFADKANQINLHITMGSGYTYAMIHSLLDCGTIFVNRRRILQAVTADGFNIDTWRLLPHAPMHMVDRIFAASHSIIHSLLSLELGADKDNILCFPIFMLFSAFTAGSTIAYLSLKGLAPTNSTETAVNLVRDSLRLCHDGSESWPLILPWQRHLSVMSKVLREVNMAGRDGDHDRESPEDSKVNSRPSPSVKDDVVSQPDTNADAMDYDQHHQAIFQGPMPPQENGRDSEPPAPRRPGIATINGGSAGASTPQTASPPPAVPQRTESPDPTGSIMMGVTGSANPGPDVDMTALELCSAFERQLLELDDLAAFMGGGV